MASEAEVAAARERLTASGLVSFDEGDTVCCYARQDKVWVTDPDGVSWEVYVLLDDMLDEDANHQAHGAENAGSACCAPAAKTAPARACC